MCGTANSPRPNALNTPTAQERPQCEQENLCPANAPVSMKLLKKPYRDNRKKTKEILPKTDERTSAVAQSMVSPPSMSFRLHSFKSDSVGLRGEIEIMLMDENPK